MAVNARVAVTWLLGCCASLLVVLSAQAACPVGHEEVPWQSLADGVWVWAPAEVADVSRANAGFVAPVTVVVDRGQALVVDPGPSHSHGVRVRESVRCRLGARVVAVANTHAHAENVLGNSAFAHVSAIYSSARTASAMAARCQQCLESLTSHVGAEAMKGTQIVLPNRVLRAGDQLRVGGQRMDVLAVEQGHTEGDLVLWMPGNRMLWMGGLAYQERVPELAQGSLEGWLATLEKLLGLNPDVVVSTVVSRGNESGAATAAMAQTRSYLLALRQRVWDVMDSGGFAHDISALALPEFRHWVGYDLRHGFNAQRAWRELEPEWMGRMSANPSTLLSEPSASLY